LQEFIEEFPNIQFESDDTIVHCIQKVYAQTKQTFVIIIDEYDVLIREQVPSAVFDNYLNFLSGIFKNSTLHPAISLAYLTGILPIVRDKIQSKMNEFDEYSMLDAAQFAEFIGFTNDEVETLCNSHNIDFEECRRWYDGYKHFDEF